MLDTTHEAAAIRLASQAADLAATLVCVQRSGKGEQLHRIAARQRVAEMRKALDAIDAGLNADVVTLARRPAPTPPDTDPQPPRAA